MMDMLRRAGLGSSRLWPVLITGGDLETQVDGHYRVPKRDLIVGLQLLLQRRGLQIALGMKFGPVLAREMAEMRVKITPSGNEQYGAWREGTVSAWRSGLGRENAERKGPQGPPRTRPC